jgi:hypothetical protein
MPLSSSNIRHECPVCGKAWDAKSKLDQHMRSHTGDKPYHCELCDFATNVSTNLNRHIKTVHRKESKYPCRFCDKVLSQKCNLDRHERTHTGEKPYSCEYCSRSFADQSSRKNHQQRCSSRPGVGLDVLSSVVLEAEQGSTYERFLKNTGKSQFKQEEEEEIKVEEQIPSPLYPVRVIAKRVTTAVNPLLSPVQLGVSKSAYRPLSSLVQGGILLSPESSLKQQKVSRSPFQSPPVTPRLPEIQQHMPYFRAPRSSASAISLGSDTSGFTRFERRSEDHQMSSSSTGQVSLERQDRWNLSEMNR